LTRFDVRWYRDIERHHSANQLDRLSVEDTLWAILGATV
jgi:hypothetical protein